MQQARSLPRARSPFGENAPEAAGSPAFHAAHAQTSPPLCLLAPIGACPFSWIPDRCSRVLRRAALAPLHKIACAQSPRSRPPRAIVLWSLSRRAAFLVPCPRERQKKGARYRAPLRSLRSRPPTTPRCVVPVIARNQRRSFLALFLDPLSLCV